MVVTAYANVLWGVIVGFFSCGLACLAGARRAKGPKSFGATLFVEYFEYLLFNVAFKCLRAASVKGK